ADHDDRPFDQNRMTHHRRYPLLRRQCFPGILLLVDLLALAHEIDGLDAELGYERRELDCGGWGLQVLDDDGVGRTLRKQLERRAALAALRVVIDRGLGHDRLSQLSRLRRQRAKVDSGRSG